MEHGNKVRVSVRSVTKVFKDKNRERPVLDNISFDIYDNEFLVLLGPGRCGKSVLLNIISGLMPATSGSITFDGKDVEAPDPEFGMVFQRTGLLPWLTVMDNVRFGPSMRNVDKSEQYSKAQYYIDMVGLTGFEKHYPYQLSGGMKQRVGIARAYANSPKVLIMDEPFGALDAQTRYNMENEVLSFAEKEKRSILFVTNNIEEALLLGDRIILLTACPASIKAIYDIPFKKPRDTMDQDFLELRKVISENTDLAL